MKGEHVMGIFSKSAYECDFRIYQLVKAQSDFELIEKIRIPYDDHGNAKYLISHKLGENVIYFYLDMSEVEVYTLYLPLYLPINRGKYKKYMLEEIVRKINDGMCYSLHNIFSSQRYFCECSSDNMVYLVSKEFAKGSVMNTFFDRIRKELSVLNDLFNEYCSPILKKNKINTSMKTFMRDANLFEATHIDSVKRERLYGFYLEELEKNNPKVYAKVKREHEKYIESICVPTKKENVQNNVVQHKENVHREGKRKYVNHCWKCKSYIDENNSRCYVCGWFICSNCGSCMEGCFRMK